MTQDEIDALNNECTEQLGDLGEIDLPFAHGAVWRALFVDALPRLPSAVQDKIASDLRKAFAVSTEQQEEWAQICRRQ